MTGQGLSRAERIRQRADFERVYADGLRVPGRFMTVFRLVTGATTPRFGVAATKKLGDAVVRNRAKRLAREIFRRHKPTDALDIVIVPRREMVDATFAELEADFLHGLSGRGRPSTPRPPGRRR